MGGALARPQRLLPRRPRTVTTARAEGSGSSPRGQKPETAGDAATAQGHRAVCSRGLRSSPSPPPRTREQLRWPALPSRLRSSEVQTRVGFLQKHRGAAAHPQPPLWPRGGLVPWDPQTQARRVCRKSRHALGSGSRFPAPVPRPGPAPAPEKSAGRDGSPEP